MRLVPGAQDLDDRLRFGPENVRGTDHAAVDQNARLRLSLRVDIADEPITGRHANPPCAQSFVVLLLVLYGTLQ